MDHAEGLSTNAAGAAVAEEAVAEALIRRGKLDRPSLERARRLRRERGSAAEHLHILLTQLGMVAEADVAAALAEVLALPLAGSADFPDEAVLPDLLSARFLKDAHVIPLAEENGAIRLAMANPLDAFSRQAVEIAARRPVQAAVALPADIERAFERLYGSGGTAISQLVDGLGEAETGERDEDEERLKDQASEAPVIRLVNLLISRAVEARASDIHIEPYESTLRVRYRIDGVLHEVETPPVKLRSAIVSRVKIMAKLNIAERRLPQDGRVKLAVRGKEVDFRVSTLPTMHGESVVLRILDKGSAKFEFSVLGFEADTLATYLDVLERPNGILLVTGPTGSGKTTTLYTSLLRLNTADKKILTVEDPIEYQLDGVNQIQVKPKIGLTFANVLRSILRQDPDIIMIGEIRDLETAQIAAQSALTGHLVLSTLHTNSAAGTVTRLLDMGLEDYLLASTVNGITAQRLVRRLCPYCSTAEPATAELIEELRLERFAPAGAPILRHRPAGCEACNGTGYHGRSAIAEMLVIDEDIRRMTLRKADARDIQRQAAEAGMRTLYDDGMRKALAGLTSIEEVLRVTRET